MENPINMDDLGGKPPIFGNTNIVYSEINKTPFYCQEELKKISL